MAKKKANSSAPHTQAGFKGYTMDELRYQRALIALKREFSKETVLENVEKLQRNSPFSNSGQKSIARNVGGVAGKMIGGLNYVDYLLIGFSAYNSISKIFKFFRRKKQ